jgi:hypothetical protein
MMKLQWLSGLLGQYVAPSERQFILPTKKNTIVSLNRISSVSVQTLVSRIFCANQFSTKTNRGHINTPCDKISLFLRANVLFSVVSKPRMSIPLQLSVHNLVTTSYLRCCEKLALQKLVCHAASA